MLGWLSRDGRLLLGARTIRTFAYGYLSVLLGFYLPQIGMDGLQIGAILSASLAGGAFSIVAASFVADRLGRRRMLIFFSWLMALSGAIFALTTDFFALLAAVIVGTVSSTGGEVGPFLPLEQAIIPQTCSERKRNTAFAIYNTMALAAGASGALSSGLPSLLQEGLGWGFILSYRPMFILYSAIALLTALLYALLSASVELKEGGPGARPFTSYRSRGIIARLSMLFGIDSFAGGFVIQSMLSYWFHIRFGLQLASVAVVFFSSNLLTALSYIAAARIADRAGLINTMVFTHIPSNILLMSIPLAPGPDLAVALFLARQSLSQMDVPTRQSYTVAVVEPGERTVAAGMTNVSRNVAQAVSPSVSGYLIQSLALSAPFIVAGLLKIAYDIALYLNFRGIKPPEEREVRLPQVLGST